MGHFRPKEVFLRAQSSEKEGNSREAANNYALLSVYFRRKNKVKHAFEMICHAIRLSPHSGRLFMEEAACLWELNDATGARDSLKKAVSVGIRQKKFHDYVKVLNKTFQDVPDLRSQFYRLWLDLDRTQADLFNLFSEDLLQQGEKEEAKKLILQGLKSETGNELLLLRLIKWGEMFGSESEREMVRQFEKKEIDIDKLIIILGLDTQKQHHSEDEKNTRSPETLPEYSKDKYELKDLSKLVEELEKKLIVDLKIPFDNIEPLVDEFVKRSSEVIGADPRARIDLANAFFEMERLGEAKAELAHIEPNHELFDQAKYLLGLIFLKEGRDLLALGAFQEARRLAKPNSNLWKEASYQLLKIYFKLNDRLSAQKLYQGLYQVDPQYRDLKSFKDFIVDLKK